MSDMKRLAEGHAMTPRHRLIRCPVYGTPFYDLAPEGIVQKCKSCRGETHVQTWEEVDRYRATLGKED